jgi:hypothetical protein
MAAIDLHMTARTGESEDIFGHANETLPPAIGIHLSGRNAIDVPGRATRTRPAVRLLGQHGGWDVLPMTGKHPNASSIAAFACRD